MDALVNKPLRRPNDDYVLDPHWDFGAPSQIRYYNWTIVDKDGNPDGVFKPMMTIDGQFPGPLIEVNEGDTIVVDVLNLATNATSIHWHGIFQNGTNFMDGTSGVTQCPIAPGYSFRYNFTLTGQAGTYFYHGHQGVQSLDGLVGPLVIHDRDAANNLPLRYESDRVVLLQDWYYDPGSGLLRDSLSPGNEAAPVPNAALINGLNQVDCSLHPGRRCVRDGTALPVLNLNPGANHRLRFANVGGFAWFQVSVDEHSSLPIVEVDGTTIEPAAESVIILSPGQRYSVILTANQATQNNYWLRARMIKACFGEPNMPEDGVDEAKAIVQYSAPSKLLGSQSDTSGLPTTNDTNINYIKTCKDMTSRSTYRPTPPQPAPEYADHSWYLRINLAIGDWRLQRGVINQSSFRPNLQEPTLHRFLDGFASSNFSFNGEGINTAAFAPSELVISNKGVETVDVILQNMDEGSHPFHLHGTQMWILGAGHGYFPGYKALGLKPQGMGLLDPNNSTVIDNPLKRDTATAEGFGWVLLRFVADNPGVWLFHCHMIWHSEAGMAMQFASRLEDMKSWALPEENRRLCGADREELYKGAPPSDDIFFGFHNDDR
ncbi:multicopper oxidase-domain-containing protein [Pseudomassariella vexata]|uniref:Multicopper oxidase-domain-containing protein n=1 Tax=Pseudomassariella vexata TaxID=1141098 RepID=A0A1Y2DFS4_9PEZI|nr:multicopper oxidase-domain-containing protein [Pseudomassariella vexata]ORY57545.1 multicopper oxidase-domain-containing protein [Pseudomassariella vexata]